MVVWRGSSVLHDLVGEQEKSNIRDDEVSAEDELWLACLAVINYVGLGLKPHPPSSAQQEAVVLAH